MLHFRPRFVAVNLMLAVAGCATASKPAPVGVRIVLTQPTVGPVEIRMSNGVIALSIVPALGGRVLSFGYQNGPNVLWTASHDSLVRRDWGAWSNIGGDKSWVWPQTDWKQRDRAWPPPAEFDTAPWTVTRMQDGEVELTSPPMPHFDSARLVRRITMPRRGERVVIQTTLWTASPGQPLPMAAWNITQVPLTAAVGVLQSHPTGDPSIKPRLDGKTSLLECDASAVTATFDRCTFTQRLLSATGSARCRVYLDPRRDRPADAYAELEWAGNPVEGNSRITVEWTLQRKK